MYDLIILGGGPAGVASAVYSVRKQLKTALITYDFNGQSAVSEKIYNWIGTPEISGMKLSEDLKKHAYSYKGDFLDILEGRKVKEVKKDNNIITVITDDDKAYQTRALLVATGSGRRKLQVPNADVFENKGITYCASCDGPMYDGQDVVVVGGGNAGFESAAQLLAYCKSVTIIHKNPEFKADEITIKKVLDNPKVKPILNAEIVRVDGDKFIKSLTYKDKATGEEHTIEVTGIFVEIGQIPNTLFVKGIVELDPIGKIVVDPMTQMSSTPGVWAAGDCTNGKYHQNSIALGDAVKATEDIYIWLHKNK